MNKPTHPVELLCCALASQEGAWDPGSIPLIRNNPGDLDYAAQLGASRPPLGSPDASIAMFATPEAGIAALFRQVWLQVAQGQTVRQIVEQWAPPADNDSTTYLANVIEWTGLPTDTPVLEILPPLVKLNG